MKATPPPFHFCFAVTPKSTMDHFAVHHDTAVTRRIDALIPSRLEAEVPPPLHFHFPLPPCFSRFAIHPYHTPHNSDGTVSLQICSESSSSDTGIHNTLFLLARQPTRLRTPPHLQTSDITALSRDVTDSDIDERLQSALVLNPTLLMTTSALESCLSLSLSLSLSIT